MVTKAGDCLMMMKIGESSRMMMAKVENFDGNAEGQGLFKDDEDEGWELFIPSEDRRLFKGDEEQDLFKNGDDEG